MNLTARAVDAQAEVRLLVRQLQTTAEAEAGRKPSQRARRRHPERDVRSEGILPTGAVAQSPRMRTEIVGAQEGMEPLREPRRGGREELAHDGAPGTGDGLSAVGPEERLEPPEARDGVVIEEGDDVGVHLGERAVSRAREPETRLADHAKGRGRVLCHAGEDG